MDTPPGQTFRIGRYEVLRPLGSGAMGTVFLARDTAINRLVALKTFRIATNAGAHDLILLRKRLLREAQSAGSLAHPNVVQVFDVVEQPDAGSFYLVLEYVDGESLERRIARRAPLPVAEATDVVQQIASALDHLHTHGVVHRDLKPANILITPQGTAKLTDFGVALADDPGQTQETALLGTPQYMAPEQLRGTFADPRSDVFALGALLYEMVTGCKAFPGTTVTEVTQSILYGSPVPAEKHRPGMDPDLVHVLERALAKDPEQRFASAGELAQALSEASRGAALAAPVTGMVSPAEMRQADLDHAATAALDSGSDPASSRGFFDLPLLRRRRHPALRWALLLLLPIVFGALIGGLVVHWSTASRAEIQARNLGYLKLVAEGQLLMARGDARGALVLFDTAAELADDPADVEPLRLEAHRLAEKQGIAGTVDEAHRAVKKGHFLEALGAARTLLATDAGHDEALAVLTEVQDALARSGLPARTNEAISTNRPEPPVTKPTTSADQAGLTVDLRSQAPAGVITVYAGKHQVLLAPFSFYEKIGWFRRKPTPGRMRRHIGLEPGRTVLRVLVARKREPANLITLVAHLARGQESTLEVHVPISGTPTARLRP